LARGKLACPSSQIKARHGEAVGPLGKPLVEVSGSSEIIHLDKQTKTPKHYEVVWRRLGTPHVEVSGSSEIIHLDKQAKTPKHYEVVWRKGQRECGFECEGENYPYTQTQTHSFFCGFE